MNVKNHFNFIKSNSGQVLLFVVVAVTIATTVGIAVATRTLSLSKRTTSTDTYSRVYYAASSGIERYMKLTDTELRSISGSSHNCSLLNGGDVNGSSVTASWNPDTNTCDFVLDTPDGVGVDVSVSLEEMWRNGSNPNTYTMVLPNGTYGMVWLSGYTSSALSVCWSPNGSPTALYYVVYGSTGILSEGGIRPNSGTLNFNVSNLGFVTADAGGTSGYSSCRNIYVGTGTGGNPHTFMAVTSIGGESTLGFTPGNVGSFPNQGFLITSKGKLSNSSEAVQLSTSIDGFRSYAGIPGFYTSALYTQGNFEATIN